jgi:transglutaminase-like putative cysteine protease
LKTVKNAKPNMDSYIENHKSETTRFIEPALNMSKAAVIIGIVCRAVICFIGICAYTLFVCDAFDIVHLESATRVYRVPESAVILAALVLSLLMVVSNINRLTKYIVPLSSLAVFLAVITVSYGNPVAFISDSLRRIYNFALKSMVSEGYTYFGSYMTDDSYSFDTSMLLLIGTLIFTTVTAFIIYECIFKKVRILPLVIVSIIYIVPILSYNITRTNKPIAMLIVFGCGALSMWFYDFNYLGARQKRQAAKEHRALMREEKRKKSEAAKQERLKLDSEADTIYKAAILAELGPAVALTARNAVYKKYRKDKKKQKKLLKLEKKKQSAEKRKEKADLIRKKREEKKKTVRQEHHNKELNIRKQKGNAEDQKSQLHRENIRKISAGGFAGIAAALIAVLAVFIPASLVKSDFTVIPFINNRVEYARAYVTQLLYGDEVDLNDENVYQSDSGMYSRTLSFDSVEFSGKLIFKVEAPTDTNVYLKSWSGTDYDESSNSWMGADSDQIVDFRQEFGSDFSSDQITTSFNKYIYPSSADYTEPDIYRNFKLYGFVSEQVNVYRMSSGADLLYIPTVLDTDVGVLKYSSGTAADFRYRNYFDGIYSSRMNTPGTGYSTYSFVTSLTNPESQSNIEMSQKYYDVSNKYIDEYNADPVSKDEIYSTYISELEKNSIKYTGTDLLTRYIAMSVEEKQQYTECVAKEQEYRQYVYDTYASASDDEDIKQLSDDIYSGVADKSDSSSYIMAVIDYLNNNYKYTLQPLLKTGTKYSDVLHAFLFDEKEGYCTHFATAAAVLLRDQGYAVRYCEGYIADGFEKNYRQNAVSEYRSDVFDSDAHAWIEVYFNDVGWVRYEVTPGYIAQAYSQGTDSSSDTQSDTVNTSGSQVNETVTEAPQDFETEAVETQASQETGSQTSSDAGVLHVVFVVAVVVAAVLLLVFIVSAFWKWLKRRSDAAVRKRYKLINDARSEKIYKDFRTDRKELSRQLDDSILDILRAVGAGPKNGELSTDYGKRLATEYKGLSRTDAVEVMRIIQKNEFGNGITFGEINVLADYLDDMITVVYSSLSLREKIEFRYIKRII